MKRKVSFGLSIIKPKKEVRIYSKTFDRNFHFSWLKDHCQCPLCIDVSSKVENSPFFKTCILNSLTLCFFVFSQKQKIHSSGECFDVDLPKSANIVNSTLVIDWGQNHVSRFSLKSLTSMTSKKQDLQRLMADRRKMNYMEIPTISYDDYMNDPVGKKEKSH